MRRYLAGGLTLLCLVSIVSATATFVPSRGFYYPDTVDAISGREYPAVFQNPAALAGSGSGQLRIDGSQNYWDYTQLGLSYVVPMPEYGWTFGLGGLSFFADDIAKVRQVGSNRPEIVSRHSHQNMAFLFSLATKISDVWHVGYRLSVYQQNLIDASAGGVAFDVGVLWYGESWYRFGFYTKHALQTGYTWSSKANDDFERLAIFTAEVDLDPMRLKSAYNGKRWRLSGEWFVDVPLSLMGDILLATDTRLERSGLGLQLRLPDVSLHYLWNHYHLDILKGNQHLFGLAFTL